MEYGSFKGWIDVVIASGAAVSNKFWIGNAKVVGVQTLDANTPGTSIKFKTAAGNPDEVPADADFVTERDSSGTDIAATITATTADQKNCFEPAKTAGFGQWCHLVVASNAGADASLRVFLESYT